jgi:DNA-binding transcriptional LysR family regulator
MIDRIEAMRTFVRIVDMNSFTRASESLGIARARTTTIVQHLEVLLGVPLLLRTTRKLTLTAEGTQYHDRCVRILADIDEAECRKTDVVAIESAGRLAVGALRRKPARGSRGSRRTEAIDGDTWWPGAIDV